MKVTALCILVIGTLVSFSDGAAEEKPCKSVLSDLTKRQLAGISNCQKSMTFKNGKDKAAKMNCVLRCVMVTEKFLAPDGSAPDDASFNTFLEETFPPSSLENAKKGFGGCMSKHGKEMDPSPADEFCKTYDGFIKCLTSAVGNLCK